MPLRLRSGDSVPATVRLLALWLVLLAASPLTASSLTMDAAKIPHGSMPDASKAKPSLDDVVLGVAFVEVAAPFPVRESWGQRQAGVRVRGSRLQRDVLRV